MRCFFHRWVAVLVIALAGSASPAARAQSPMQPPYDMRWGDSPEKMIAWAKSHEMDIHIFLPGDQPALRVVRIEPRAGFIPETADVRSVEGRFLIGRMIELTVHYADPKASFEQMLARFDKLRRALAAEHGALRANRALREVDGGFVIRTRSFHREPVKGLFLLLTLTTIEDQNQRGGKARYSVVYRNENLKAELDEPAADR